MAEWTRAAGVAAEIEFAPPAQREIIERLAAHRGRAAAASAE